MIRITGLLLFIFMVLGSSCKKDQLLTSSDARIGTSSDSLYFDTLFTQALSITQSLRIYNENDQQIKISSISLANGNNSVFRFNVNGVPGPTLTDIDIAANDSIHVFVQTRLPDGNNPQPFIIEDSILVKWNNNSRAIKLSAWGQQARYIKNGLVAEYTTWDNSLPYVLLGPMKIAEQAILHIEKGTRIYCHADALIKVDGSLEVSGDSAFNDRVIFTGDRLDLPYKNYPASWPGIYFTKKSHHNSLAYTIIQNAYQGIIAEGLPPGEEKKIVLEQCIIKNIWDAGLLAINSSAILNNCLIADCGKNVQLVYGGDYQFTHCTLASYSSLYAAHLEPVLFVTDAIASDGQWKTAPLKAQFTNSIFWGEGSTVDNEVVAIRQGNDPFSVQFNQGLWRMLDIPASITQSGMVNGMDPLFELTTGEPVDHNFRLQPGSPALDVAQSSPLTIDLDGKPRNIGIPDLGAFEKQ